MVMKRKEPTIFQPHLVYNELSPEGQRLYGGAFIAWLLLCAIGIGLFVLSHYERDLNIWFAETFRPEQVTLRLRGRCHVQNNKYSFFYSWDARIEDGQPVCSLEDAPGYYEMPGQIERRWPRGRR